MSFCLDKSSSLEKKVPPLTGSLYKYYDIIWSQEIPKISKENQLKANRPKPSTTVAQSRALDFAAQFDLEKELQMTPNLFCWIPHFLKFQLVLHSFALPFCTSSCMAAKKSLFPGCIIPQRGRLYSFTLDADLRGQMTSK